MTLDALFADKGTDSQAQAILSKCMQRKVPETKSEEIWNRENWQPDKRSVHFPNFFFFFFKSPSLFLQILYC